MQTKKTAIFVLKLLFIAALFVAIFRPETFGLPSNLFQDITLTSLVEAFRELDPGSVAFWLTFAVVIKLLGILCGILRWRLLLRAQRVRIPFWYLAKCWFMGRAIGLLLPSTLGLDGYRLVESSRYTGEVIKCATVVVVEKVLGFIALFLLVFLVLPFSMRFFDYRPVMLALMLAALACVIAAALIVLMNPRGLQVLVSVIPLPGKMQGKLFKLGASLGAFSAHKGTLLLAVLLGIGVHFAISLMYFGTGMAIGLANVDIWELLFVGTMVTVGSVLTPTLSGAGVREFAFAFFLRARGNPAKAVMAGHLGLWAGEIIPFVLSWPLLLFTTRPERQRLEEEAGDLRGQLEHEGAPETRLSDEEVVAYRRRVYGVLLAGLLAGLIGGALIGLAEAAWLGYSLDGLTEYHAFAWAPWAYGLVFGAAGLGAGVALSLVYLVFNGFPRPQISFALVLGGLLALAAFVIGAWRFNRDILGGHGLAPPHLAVALAAALGIGAAAALSASLLLAWTPGSRWTAAAAGLAAFIVLGTAGGQASKRLAPAETPPNFEPGVAAAGPNIIFIAADALRADYLPLYAEHSAMAALPPEERHIAETPNLEQFAAEGVHFVNAYSQASWTKPSFATLFTGLYPSHHTATGKASVLPEELVTAPELLSEAGYYVKGFANNPNITATFNFDQGFTDYTDLKPRHMFNAGFSTSKLVLYEVLRKVKHKVEGKLPLALGGGMDVREHYQPADAVTEAAVTWLTSEARPKDAPFFLFLHYMDPHDPFMDHDRPGVGYARVRLGNPDADAYLEPMRDAYLDDIAFMDEQLGALFDFLRDSGLYDDALIIFTADHGEEFFDHGGWWHGQTLYDELIHIPLVVKLPGGALAGQTSERLTRHVDLAPTFLTTAGAEPPAELPGAGLFDADWGVTETPARFSYAENDFEDNILEAVRTKEAKLITANKGNPRGAAPLELYDLVEDPLESNDLLEPLEETPGPGWEQRRQARLETLEGMEPFAHLDDWLATALDAARGAGRLTVEALETWVAEQRQRLEEAQGGPPPPAAELLDRLEAFTERFAEEAGPVEAQEAEDLRALEEQMESLGYLE